MYQFLIKGYIDRLTKEDIVNYARENGFILTDNELDFIFTTIKKEWQDFFNGKSAAILEKTKHNVREEVYLYILHLYDYYKDKL